MASPLARRLAAEQGMDIDRMHGSGPGGEVVAADIQRAPAPFEVPVPGNGRPMKSMEKAISRAMASSVSMPTFHVTAHIHLEILAVIESIPNSKTRILILAPDNIDLNFISCS